MRLLIVALMLAMAALPFIFGDPFRQMPSSPAEPLIAATPTVPGTKEQWFEFLRAAFGAFVGAGAAFGFNFWLQMRAERRKEMAAGNNALATVGHLYIVFRKVRRMLEEEVQRHKHEAPEMPLWLIFRPPLHFLREDRHFDFEGLAFLFESKNAAAHEELFHLEEAHRDLMGHVRQLREFLLKKQDKAEAAGLMNKPTAKIGELKEAVGARLVIEIEGELETLTEHVKTTGVEYLRVAAVLRQALVEHFGPDGIIRIQEPPEPAKKA